MRKHAGATRVHVAVRREETSVRLEVQDWGSGFDSLEAHRAGTSGEHFGLASMRERVGLLGGTLELRSKPGGGTRVLAAVPLAPEPHAGRKRAA
ncbi:MAG: ATP-binding protein [Chloroflexota bacterium]|nr:ATP-binding protein [Chloroflexota bacterium]